MVDAHAVRRAIYNNGSVAETLGSYVGCQANAVLGYRCLNRNLPDVTAAKAIERAGQVRARVRVRVRVRFRVRVRARARVRVRVRVRARVRAQHHRELCVVHAHLVRVRVRVRVS